MAACKVGHVGVIAVTTTVQVFLSRVRAIDHIKPIIIDLVCGLQIAGVVRKTAQNPDNLNSITANNSESSSHGEFLRREIFSNVFPVSQKDNFSVSRANANGG